MAAFVLATSRVRSRFEVSRDSGTVSRCGAEAWREQLPKRTVGSVLTSEGSSHPSLSSAFESRHHRGSFCPRSSPSDLARSPRSPFYLLAGVAARGHLGHLLVPKADSDPCSHRCYRFSQNLPFHVREQQLEDVLKRLHQWSVVTAQCSNPGTLSAAQLSKPGAGITLEPSEEAKPHTKKSLLECWPGFGRSQVAWSSEVFPVRNPCWGCFPWLSQGEGTALEFLQPQAGDASPENQFRIIHLALSLTCGFQGAFWSSGYSQERIFHHLTFKPGIPNPHRSRGKLVKG
ncbi:uncharacterized protein LOC125333970 [Corvus hawaiiensis]|uniref:uncharacterized protein LOC125333970 n=1 Tax=Corvus hawaiiensis TaxID=134902 RepID=UPI0020186C2F|nr:uncharacterized protein LOC125333970 [Corvus hawaiiensis]